MIRPDRVLHNLPVAKWTRSETISHLRTTFDRAARQHPGLMEPYAIRLDGANDDECVAIMREALRDTFKQRYPR